MLVFVTIHSCVEESQVAALVSSRNKNTNAQNESRICAVFSFRWHCITAGNDEAILVHLPSSCRSLIVLSTVCFFKKKTCLDGSGWLHLHLSSSPPLVYLFTFLSLSHELIFLNEFLTTLVSPLFRNIFAIQQPLLNCFSCRTEIRKPES